MRPKSPVVRGWFWLTPLVLWCSGCADKSLISLSAEFDNPSVKVTKGTLGSEMGGGFDLRLSLGSKASEATGVSLGSFSLARASDQSNLVDTLQVTASGATFPVTVAPGKTVVVPFQIGGTALLKTADGQAICAGPVLILGAVTDSLSGGHTTSLRTNPVTPVCQ